MGKDKQKATLQEMDSAPGVRFGAGPRGKPSKDNVTRDGFSPGHEVRRGPNRRAGEAPERAQERRHEEKRNPHLHAVRSQAEPAWSQAAGSLLLAIASLVWGGVAPV